MIFLSFHYIFSFHCCQYSHAKHPTVHNLIANIITNSISHIQAISSLPLRIFLLNNNFVPYENKNSRDTYILATTPEGVGWMAQLTTVRSGFLHHSLFATATTMALKFSLPHESLRQENERILFYAILYPFISKYHPQQNERNNSSRFVYFLFTALCGWCWVLQIGLEWHPFLF